MTVTMTVKCTLMRSTLSVLTMGGSRTTLWFSCLKDTQKKYDSLALCQLDRCIHADYEHVVHWSKQSILHRLCGTVGSVTRSHMFASSRSKTEAIVLHVGHCHGYGHGHVTVTSWSRSRSRSRNIYFSNISWRNMNNQSPGHVTVTQDLIQP